MSLRIQKRVSQIGAPLQAGETVSRALNGTLVLSEANLTQIAAFNDPILVLEHADDDDFETRWIVVEVRAE